MYSTTQRTKDARRADAKQTIEQATTDLLDEIQAGRSTLLVEFLTFAAQFHKYSWANQAIIAAHGRKRGLHASHVASFAAWQKIGQERHGKPYNVAKGEHAIWIWAPAFHKAEEGKMIRRNGKEVADEDYTYFILCPTFADYQIDQSEGQPPMDAFWKPLSDDDEARHLYSVLVDVATAEGFTCEEEARTDQVQGYNQGKLIVVKSSLDATSKTNVFIHELTHAMLHHGKSELSLQERELEAESVAFIVAHHFGIENPFSVAYLQMYGADKQTLSARLDSICKAAHTIIEKVEKALHSELAEAA